MAVIQEYKCPNCGGALAFDSKLQKMKCPFCDSTFDMEELKSADDKFNDQVKQEQENGQANGDNMNWDTSAGSEWQDGEENNFCSYVCKSCGGEIIGDKTTAATSCPYCGNPVVIMEQFSGMLKPDYVIPFKLDKEKAKEALKNHYSGKPLLPKVFKTQNHIDEIKGIYVPFWLFDADVHANINYNATKIRHWSDSNYDYTETSYFKISRSGNISFERVPVDGSSKMPDDLMESIEPFNFSDAVDFQTAYMAGYLADKYDVNSEQSIERANTRIKKSTEDNFASTVHGYNTVTPEYSNINLNNGKVKYALYPVWILNTKWQKENYLFAMNGQTGKLVGNLPMDKSAFIKWFIALTIIVGAVVFGITYLLWLF